MNYQNDNDMWDWQGQDYCLEDDTSIGEMSKSLLNGVNQNVDHMSYMFDGAATPVKACGDLAYHVTNNVFSNGFSYLFSYDLPLGCIDVSLFIYGTSGFESVDVARICEYSRDNALFLRLNAAHLHFIEQNAEVTGKELEQYREPSSQVKRRRVLQFESEVLDAPLCNDEAFLRSKETPDSLEDALSEMSQWVAGFTEGTSASSNDCLDPSSEGWIADCFNDAGMHFCTEDISASGASDVPIDITELCDTPPEYDANPVKKHPVHINGNVVFKGRKSYMRTPPKLASSVVYPFAFIKPCGVHGHVTLKDINQRIHNPPTTKPNEEDPSVSFPTSAFSGKPVVGKTKIRTEGGKGSITIMRTKG
ncbi:UNVERIFIED_CONTAM: protein XRI1 [Sesamum angustifolium]|uniref:Protein XRI1 n=1 Tax=Sesamum angustifolium TaxID=2727405 RepID=A0AAW2J2W9_9LAMI